MFSDDAASPRSSSKSSLAARENGGREGGARRTLGLHLGYLLDGVAKVCARYSQTVVAYAAVEELHHVLKSTRGQGSARVRDVAFENLPKAGRDRFQRVIPVAGLRSDERQ